MIPCGYNFSFQSLWHAFISVCVLVQDLWYVYSLIDQPAGWDGYPPGIMIDDDVIIILYVSVNKSFTNPPCNFSYDQPVGWDVLTAQSVRDL